MIKVYHNPDFLKFEHSTKVIDLNKLVHVADVESDIMEDGYALTQNNYQSWEYNDNVVSHVGPARSTSVGDVFERDGKKYLVAGMGFKDLDEDGNILE